MRMLLVGLTGGIGSGKSTVAAMLAERGAIIVDADQVARDLQQPGSALLTRMAERFGAHILRDDGSLDRAAVAAIVFGDDESARAARLDLNAITHPAIHREIERRIDAVRARDAIVVLDHPLLADIAARPLDAVVVVDVDVDTAVQRLVRWRGMDESDARRRVASQVTREQRLRTATHVIDNSRDVAALDPQIERLWGELTALQASGPL